MPAPYAGSPVFPSDFPLVDDGVSPNGTNFNPALEALGDRTAYLKALADGNAVKPIIRRWLGSGSFTLPADALPFFVFAGCGGGGAGGRGGGSQPANQTSTGGGGGGGAQLVSGICAAFPGESHSVTIGPGGTGVDPFGIGNYGGDTLITRDLDNSVLACCAGAGGGHPGPLSGFGPLAANSAYIGAVLTADVTQFGFARGGGPVRPPGTTIEPPATPSMNSGDCYSQAPGSGGAGTTEVPGSLTGRNGIASGSYQGGFGGTTGTDNVGDPTRYGGGAGGGGGGGAYGVGGLGGSGTHATGSGGPSDPPTAGGNGLPNTGAGGGGGGAAGSGDPQTTTGAAPGNGGTGQITIMYFIPMELP